MQRIVWSDAGVTAILASGEKIEADRALIAVPLGLLRAGLPALDPLPPEDQQKAIGRLGYGAGILGKIYLRFPKRFWPDHPKWFGRLPDAPDKRGTFNTWVSHEQETGRPILLSFSNGATAAHLDRAASDAEVKDVAMASLRKMFGDAVVEPEAMVYPRWLSDPVVARWLFLSGRRQRARGSRGACPAARPAGVFCRRGDRAGRVWHGARGLVVRRAGGGSDLQGRDRNGRQDRCTAVVRRTHGRRAAQRRTLIMTLANILFVLVIVSGLATLGMLFVGLFSMARNTENTVEGGKRSNRFMWWRVRLQFLTIILIVLWYLASRS